MFRKRIDRLFTTQKIAYDRPFFGSSVLAEYSKDILVAIYFFSYCL